MSPGVRTAVGIGAALLVAGVAAAMMRRAPAVAPTPEREDDLIVPSNTEIFGHYVSYALPTDLKYKPRLYRRGEIKPVITTHVTDIAGGFGVVEYQIAPWRTRLRKGKVAKELLEQLPHPTDIEESARILALLERLHGNAYHRIGSRVLGDIKNYPLTLRTSHGDAGNIGPGWALDADNAEAMTPALIKAGRSSLEGLITEVAELTGKQVVLVGHRVWEWPDKAEDPGAIVWREIVIPSMAATGAIAGYNTVAGGRPIPRHWDPNALYDNDGNKLELVS